MDPLVAVGTLKKRSPIGELVTGVNLPSSHYLPCDGVSLCTNPAAVAQLAACLPKTVSTMRNPGFGGIVADVAVVGSRLVAIGNAFVKTSDDAGTTWVTRAIGAFNWVKLAVNGTSVMAVAYNGATTYSPDGGTTWSAKASTSSSLKAIFASGGRWFVLFGATLQTTDDNGTSWQSRTLPTTSGSYLGIGGDSSLLVAGGPNQLGTSTDNGTTWVERGSGIGIFGGYAKSGGVHIAFSGDYVTTGVGAYHTSIDGVTWVPSGTFIAFTANVGGRLLALGSNGTFFDITNPLSPISGPYVASTQLGAVAVGNTLMVPAISGLFESGDFGKSVVQRPTPTVLTAGHKYAVVGNTLVCLKSDTDSFTTLIDTTVVQAPTVQYNTVFLVGSASASQTTPYLRHYLRIA